MTYLAATIYLAVSAGLFTFRLLDGDTLEEALAWLVFWPVIVCMFAIGAVLLLIGSEKC